MTKEQKGLEEFIRPENIEDLIAEITPSIYASLQEAIALGKWGDGSPLSDEQKERCMQAVILYEARNIPEEDRIGAVLASCPSAKKMH